MKKFNITYNTLIKVLNESDTGKVYCDTSLLNDTEDLIKDIINAFTDPHKRDTEQLRRAVVKVDVEVDKDGDVYLGASYTDNDLLQIIQLWGDDDTDVSTFAYSGNNYSQAKQVLLNSSRQYFEYLELSPETIKKATARINVISDKIYSYLNKFPITFKVFSDVQECVQLGIEIDFDACKQRIIQQYKQPFIQVIDAANIDYDYKQLLNRNLDYITFAVRVNTPSSIFTYTYTEQLFKDANQHLTIRIDCGIDDINSTNKNSKRYVNQQQALQHLYELIEKRCGIDVWLGGELVKITYNQPVIENVYNSTLQTIQSFLNCLPERFTPDWYISDSAVITIYVVVNVQQLNMQHILDAGSEGVAEEDNILDW